MSDQSLLSLLSQVHELVEILDSSVIALDRANIVRVCSNIQYCLSDITEYAIPDGYIVEVKPLSR